MNREMKMRSRMLNDSEAELLVLIRHPMENGFRVDQQTGGRIPAHHIQQITVEHRQQVVVTLAVGGGVSQNPLLGFLIPDARPGDRVRVHWQDNQGESGEAEATVDA